MLSGQPAHANRSSHEASCRYFEQVYFDSPWADAGLPSLISTDDADRPNGFLGVTPRPMVLNGKRIVAAMSSNFHARRDGPNGMRQDPLVALRLLKVFFQGSQDLSVASDGNRLSKRVWERCGGVAASLYSMNWIRPILPARAVVELVAAGGGRMRTTTLQSLANGIDALAGRAVLARVAGRDGGYSSGQVSTDLVADALTRVPDVDLRPEYCSSSLAWLLEMSRHRAADGDLRSAAVNDATGRSVGWFVYVRKREAIADMLQLVAADGHLLPVLQVAIRDAATRGIALLRGDVNPADLQSYRDAYCPLTTGRWMLVQSQRREVLETFTRGRALFTGLDGERWIRSFRTAGALG